MRDYAESPLGIFDSGVGGLTVVKEILMQLPGEDFIYLGDTARYPYGPRSVEIIKKFALQNARFLMGFGIKVLIVACNTASSVALDEIKRWIKIPVIGVIEPGAEEALKTTKNGKIGVIGTVGTISSGAYQEAIKRLNPGVSVCGKPCPLFVPLAEEGFTEGEIPEKVAHFYLDELVRQGRKVKVVDNTTGEDLTVRVLGKTFLSSLKKWPDQRQSLEILKLLISEGGESSMEILKKTVLASLGAFEVTRQKAEEVIDSLIQKGEIAKSDRSNAITEILEKAEGSTKKLKDRISEDITSTVEKLKVARKKDLETLESKVDELIATVKKLEEKLSS